MRIGSGTRRGLSIAMTVVLLTGVFSLVSAVSDYLSVFNTRYGTSGTPLNNCSLCHIGSPGNADFNPYGVAFDNIGSHGSNPGGAFASIEGLDSDGDGYSNLAEIQARTFPGDASSHPVVSDSSPPTVNTFTVPASATSLTVPVTGFTASDNVAVTGYMITTTSTPPVAGASGWSTTPPTSYTAASPGTLTLYAWAKDGAGNVSTPLSSSVTITLGTSLTVTLANAGTGSGTVTSSPSGISCGSTCSASYTSGTPVTLTATPDTSSFFVGWSSPCSGNGTCTITLSTDTTVTATFVPKGYPFTDVPSTHWAASYITALYYGAITTGYGGTSEFMPDYEVTRDQMAAFIIRSLEGEPPATTCDSGCYFTDVDISGWACKYIQTLYDLSITTGYGGTNQYRPELTVTREQMAAFIIRALENEPAADYCDSGSPFSDVPSTSWSCKYIKRLYERGITTGYGGTALYRPELIVTRAQMAAFIGRAFLGMQ